MRLRTFVTLALLGLVAPACDGPTAGELSIDLLTPSNSDGAILFKIETPSSKELGDVTATCSDCQAYAFRVNESELYCAVTGSLMSGPLVRIVVSDASVRSAYAVTILEIAGRDHRLRSAVGYDLQLSH
jgi:hypothetical protein